MKNNNKFRWKRTATGVSIGLLLMCNTATAQVEGAQPEQDQNTFTLNLKNTDINSLIATVSKQTGRNFVVDPRVKAKVTVISTDPVSADGLYEVFLSVLQVHGYSAVPAGDLIKIVPDVTAKQGPVPILGEDSNPSDQLVTQVIAVVNVPAAQLVPILRPMVPQQGHLAAYAATNSLIVTDRASNIQRLMEIIRRIDRPDNEEIEVVRLNHAAASEIVGTLNSLQSNNVGGPQGPGAIQLVADDRTNSVLISGDRAARVRVRGLIAHLDTPIESGGNTRVVYLKFANAEDMVTILQGVSQGQAAVGATTTDSGGGAPNVTPPVQPTPQGQQPANNVAQRPQNNAVTPRSAAETGESSVDIQADPNTNALIITAPPDEMQNILAVVRQLDIRRAQVLVEAVIAEITEDNTREFGINFLLDGTDSDAPVGFSNLGGGTDGALGIAGALESGLPPASLGAGLSLALGRFGSGEIDFGFLVRAIASDADNNILSTPSIVTLDNEEAEIIVGENVPFVTGQQLSTNNDNPFQTVERQDIGLTLKVKPQINDGNTIKMELEQEVSSVNPTAVTGAADITTSKRSIKTTVLVDDGQTLVLGGLIDDQISDVEEKVPLLGDIPVLGRLFRFRTTTKTKQNLMIFLHPVILRDNDSATQLSNSKYNSLRSRQRFFQQQKNNSVIKEEQELPELKLIFEGRNIVGPQTSLDAPVAPDGPQSIAKLADGTGVKGLSVAGGSATTSPAPADIEQVISAYNAEQADEILAGNTADDAKPVEINTDNKPDLPAIYLQLAESISPTATVPAAVTTVTQAETDQETQQPAAIVAATQTEEEAVKEIPASSRSKKLNGVSVTFNEEHNASVPPAVVEPLVKESIAEVAAVEPVIEETISEPSVDETANVEPVAEDVVETPDLATDEPTADQVAIAEPVSEDNVAPLEDVDHAAVEQAMDKLLADLTTVETVIEENIALTDHAEQAAVEQAMDELLAELSTTETVIEDTDALADDLAPITAEPVIDELVADVAAEPVTDNLLPETPVIDEQPLEIVETIAVAPEYVDNIDSDIVDRSQDNLDDDRPEVVILSVTANGEPANDFDIDKFWDMQRTPRY